MGWETLTARLVGCQEDVDGGGARRLTVHPLM